MLEWVCIGCSRPFSHRASINRKGLPHPSPFYYYKYEVFGVFILFLLLTVVFLSSICLSKFCCNLLALAVVLLHGLHRATLFTGIQYQPTLKITFLASFSSSILRLLS